MKRVGIFTLGSLLLSPFVICLVSNSLPIIVGGFVYLGLLLRLTPKSWRKRFMIVSARYSKLIG